MLLRYLQPRAARPARVAGAVRLAGADAAAVPAAVGVARRVAAEAAAVAVPVAAVGVMGVPAAIAAAVAAPDRIAAKEVSSSKT